MEDMMKDQDWKLVNPISIWKLDFYNFIFNKQYHRKNKLDMSDMQELTPKAPETWPILFTLQTLVPGSNVK